MHCFQQKHVKLYSYSYNANSLRLHYKKTVILTQFIRKSRSRLMLEKELYADKNRKTNTGTSETHSFNTKTYTCTCTRKIHQDCNFRSFRVKDEVHGICSSMSRHTRPFSTRLLKRRVIDDRFLWSIEISKKIQKREQSLLRGV